jgi:hypothetical protein
MAQRTASTTLRNSTIAPSPVRLTMPPVADSDCGINQIAAQRAQPCQNAILVRSCEPAVADNIGNQDRSDLPGFGHDPLTAMQYHRNPRPARWPVKSDRVKKAGPSDGPDRSDNAVREWPLFAHSGRLEST